MNKTDRRVRRTRRALHEALLDLILEVGYDSITVQDITDRADLSRATFYLHYQDKEELLASSLEAMFDELVAARVDKLSPDTMTGADGTPPSQIAFEHAAEYSAIYRSLLGERGVASVMHRIRAYLAQLTRHQLAQTLPREAKTTVPTEIIAQYIAGAIFGLIVWWLENDMPHSPEAMAQMFHRMVLPGILATLEGP